MTAGRFYWFRRLMVRLHRVFGEKRQGVPALESSALEPVDIRSAVKAIRQDGVFPGLRMREETRREIIEFLNQRTCYGNGDRACSFRYAGKQKAECQYGRTLTIGRYYYVRRDCSAIERLSRDPILQTLASEYFQAEGIPIGARAWWSFAAGASAAQQMRDGQAFHYDLDGYGALCFFFYLTDVDAASGPHICVRGSHRVKPGRTYLSLSRAETDERIRKYYGQERIAVLEGPAGSGIAEDTSCFHKGLHPQRNDRLILQVRFGISDLGAATDEADIAFDSVNTASAAGAGAGY